MDGGTIGSYGVVHPDATAPVIEPAGIFEVCQMAGNR